MLVVMMMLFANNDDGRTLSVITVWHRRTVRSALFISAEYYLWCCAVRISDLNTRYFSYDVWSLSYCTAFDAVRNSCFEGSPWTVRCDAV